eukprot:1142312-Pelagomonas_calceolata.AAC.4
MRTLTTSIKNEETHWLRAMGPLHHNAIVLKGLMGIWREPPCESLSRPTGTSGSTPESVRGRLWGLIGSQQPGARGAKKERKKKKYVGRGTLPTTIKEKETDWLRRAMSLLHHKAQSELFQATKPHRLFEHQQQRQVEKEEDAEVDLDHQLWIKELALQQSRTRQQRDLSWLKQQGRNHSIACLPTQRAAKGGNPPSHNPFWDSLLATVEAKCSKLARLSLSAFCRAFEASGYALSKLVFHAKFKEVSSHISRTLQALKAGAAYSGRLGMLGGIPSNLLVGSP